MRTFALLFFFLSAYASAVPKYDVFAIGRDSVEFSNQGSFEIVFQDTFQILGWQAGDQVTLQAAVHPFLPWINEVKRGAFKVHPMIVLFNETKGRSAIGHLTEASVLGGGAFGVSSIDLAARTVTLSDATEWRFGPEDEEKVGLWLVNDIVLIGENKKFSSFDSFLFNVEDLSVVEASEQ